MITIKPSPTADTRTCDFINVSKETLLESSHQHIADVREGLRYFGSVLAKASENHDFDKITDIDGFHRDFVTGFKQTEWWDRHRQLNRHHLNNDDGVRGDVNLIDVLDFIADCVMAGMARSGSVTSLRLSPELLEKAFQNTVELLKRNVQVGLQIPVRHNLGASISDSFISWCKSRFATILVLPFFRHRKMVTCSDAAPVLGGKP